MRVRAAQRAPAAALGHRQAVRPEDRTAAWSAATTPTRSPRRSTCSSTSIMNPFMGAGALGQAVDEFNGDNFDHGPARLHRRRLHRAVDDRRPADPAAPACPKARRSGAAAGRRRWRENYLKSALDRDPRQRHELSRLLPRPRSDLPRRLRQSAAAPDLRLPRQRAQDVAAS